MLSGSEASKILPGHIVGV